ncbi:MAG: tryptophan 7-halogenase [Thermoanaerobaculia bacterium]|nr:tryptophan 7-halogenase [Thermoanaerobaculia bacterium]
MSATDGPPRDFDAIVLGGGPAGTAAAIRLAGHGRRVLLVERDRFPRFHIGESLLPTTNAAFAALGVAEAVRAAGFPAKWGASFLTHDGSFQRYADFSASGELPEPQTWQVERAVLDEILLDRAAAVGVEVRPGHRVLACDFAGRGVEVTFRDEEDAQYRARAAAAVDASGRAGLLARQFGLRRVDPRLANISVYAHYRGVPPLEGRRAGDIRIVARADAGWFWVIPLREGVTSVGVVLPKPLFERLPRGSHEGMLAHAVAGTPAMAELMREAELARPARVEKEFSYAASAYAGDRFLLAGDAGSFLDPVFSSGVAIALDSGIEAADALDRALARGETGRAAFAAFERRQRARYEAFRRFVLAFYSAGFRDLFFQPGAHPRIFAAVVTVLGGRWRPGPVNRLWIALFFLLAQLQRHVELVPRIYPRERTDDALLA